MSSELPAEILSQSSHLWNQISGAPQAALLRLSILRDLQRTVHAERSRCLASGQKETCNSLTAWEERLDRLRQASSLEGDLKTVLDNALKAKKRTRLLPESVFAVIDREKLERYDRLWEQAIAAEACALGWNFWTLEAWVEINAAEAWTRNLAEQLWPNGTLLFVDNADFIEPATPGGQALWKGSWVVLLEPRFQSAKDIGIDVTSWDGSPYGPPSAPQWKRIFSSKRL